MSNKNQGPMKRWSLYISKNKIADEEEMTLTQREESSSCSQCKFFVTFKVNYEVEYEDLHLHMCLKSEKKPSFSLDRSHFFDRDKVQETMKKVFRNTLVPEEEVESISKVVSSRVKAIHDDPRNAGIRVIPIAMLVRVVWVQKYDVEAEMAWSWLLPGGGGLSSHMPAMEKSVEELEKMAFDKDNDLRSEQCSICLNEFEDGEEVVRMPCLHIYHGDCITKWLKKSHLCPSCRFPMPVCRVVDGTFPFLKRKCRVLLGRAGGKITRVGARMSVRYQAY